MMKEGIFIEDYHYDLEKKLVAFVLVEIPKDIKKRLNLDYKFDEQDFKLVLENLENKNLNRESAFEVMADIANKKKIDLSKYKQVDNSELEKEIKEIVKKNKNLTVGALMGIVMNKHRGKVEGKVVSEMIRKYL